jgi:ATP-binding cassette, subfamily B (MDR/TAP), member 8
MTVFTVGIISVVVAAGALSGSFLRRLSARAQAQSGVVAGFAAEAFQNIRTVKVFAMEDAELRLFYVIFCCMF